MIAKLLVVSAAWLVISVLLAGVGALVRMSFGSRVAGETDLFFDWWVGWAVTIAWLLAWHLVLAITAWSWAPIALAGGSGAWMARKEWALALKPTQQRRGWLVGMIVLAVLAVAALSLGPERQYDTALYHLQSVRWAQAYPVVPGLGNVDFRFAMNSSFFLFGALVETIQMGGKELRLAAGLLFLPLIVQGIVTLHASIIGKQKLDSLRWLQVLMIPVAVWQARQYSSSLSPDGVVFALTVVLSAELLRILRRTEADWNYRLFGIALLAVTGVTVKISFAVFGVVLGAVVIWQWSKMPARKASVLIRTIVATILFTALWMFHGLILSGYIAYPSPVGSLPVDWRVPRSVVTREAEWIIAWARSPGMRPRDVLGNNQWLARWMANVARDRDVIAVAFALLLAAGLRLARPRSTEPSTTPAPANAFIFLVPSLVALGVWFVTAPAIRFTLGPLWVIGIGTLALSAARTPRRATTGMHLTILLTLGIAFIIGLAEADSRSSSPPITQMTTLSGLTVNVPSSGDQCGDAPLPCSSQQPDQRLELRQPGSLAKGFRIR